MSFEVGKYYRFAGKCGDVYWSKEMRKVLDGEPRKCTYYKAIESYTIRDCFEANFEGVPIPDREIDQIGWRWGENDIFEEVQMEPIVGKKYWVGDKSEAGCLNDKEDENGFITTWKYFIPVLDDTYEIVHKKGVGCRMKRYTAKKEEVETTSEIGKICGFICTDGCKGYLVYVGVDDKLSAVLAEELYALPNVSCGDNVINQFTSVNDFVQNANKKFSSYDVVVEVKEIYFFDTLKEMHRWLSE